jgi:cell volume regulation protein A
MNGVDLFLLCLAAILVLGSVGGVLFTRVGIPDALCLVAAGIIVGPVLGLVDQASLTAIAPFLGAITIIVVLFEGGSRLELAGVLRGSLRAILLALAGFTVSAALVAGAVVVGAAIGLLPGEWNWRYGLLIGVILGGSSSVVVMPAVLQLGLPERIASLVSTESALTDILCVVGATSLLAVMVATNGSEPDPAVSLGVTFGVGLAAGAVAGLASVLFASVLRSAVYAYPLLLATLLLLYAIVDANRGSGALAVLIFALLMGNFGLRVAADSSVLAGSLDHTARIAHTEITFIVKAVFFTFMGAMLGRPTIAMAFGVGLGLLLAVARVAAVNLALTGSSLDRGERGVVTALVPRGLAAGVLATFPVTAGLKGAEQMPEIVYAAVITTIVVFALTLPRARAGLKPSPEIASGVGSETADSGAAHEPAAAG